MKLKLDMMVTGLKVIDEWITEIEMVKIVQGVNQKKSVMDFVGKSFLDVQRDMQKKKPHRSKIYVDRESCMDVMPLSHVEITIELKGSG